MATYTGNTEWSARHEQDRVRRKTTKANVGRTERMLTAIAGGGLLGYGLTRHERAGYWIAAAGGALIVRAATGYCPLYQALGIRTNKRPRKTPPSVDHGYGTKVEKSVRIGRPREELYRFWRNLENLPLFMSHLESVRVTGGGRSHWIARGPAGTTVEWDAEIHNEVPREILAWRSLENSEINHAGSVHFTPLDGDRATEVRVVLSYEAPAGKIGKLIARMLGEEPGQQVEDDLYRLKELLERETPPPVVDQPPGPSTQPMGL
jgi:uncharacterized membrane protein